MKTLLQQLQALAPLAAAATPGPVLVERGRLTIPYSDIQPGRVPLAYVNGLLANAANEAELFAAARNLLTPENLALLIARQAAPVAGLSADMIRMLRADAAGLLAEEQWKELQREGDADDGAVQGRAYLATQLLASLAAPVAGRAFGVQMLPAAEGPGATLWGEHLYVLLPDGTITQAMWCDFFINELEGEAWGRYTDVDEVNPLPVQPTHYFTPPTAPADAA